MPSDWSKIYVLPFTKAKIGLKAPSILNLLPPLSPTVTVCVVVELSLPKSSCKVSNELFKLRDLEPPSSNKCPPE